MILSNPKIEEMKDDQLEPDIQQFNMRFKTDEENNKTISFILTNLRFIVTAPTLERLTKFHQKMVILQGDKDKRELERRKNQEIVKNIKKEKDDKEKDSENISEHEVESSEEEKYVRGYSNIVKGSGNTTQKFAKQFQEKLLLNEKRNQEDDTKEDKGELKKTEKENSTPFQRYTTSKPSFVTNLRGKIEGIEIWIPIDPKDSNSRVLSLSINSNLKMKIKNDMFIEMDNLTKEIKKFETVKSLTDLKCYVEKLTIIMINRHLEDIHEAEGEEVLLLPTSICIVYDQLVQPGLDSDISNVGITLEPLELKVGFREIDQFKEIKKTVDDLLLKMDPKGSSKLERQIKEFESIREQLHIFNEKEDFYIDDNGYKRKSYFKKRRKKQLILMNIDIDLRSFVISIMNDTVMHEYPCININFHDLHAEIINETGIDDPATFLLKRMSLYKYPLQEITARLNSGANYFNINNGAYEPLIEPWSINFHMKQRDNGSNKMIDLKSEKMININLTHAMTIVLKMAMDVMDKNKDDWIDERKLEEMKRNFTKNLVSPVKALGDKKKSLELSEKQKSPLKKKLSSIMKDNEQNYETDSFNFENNIDVQMSIQIEDFKEKYEKFESLMTESQKIEFSESSMLELSTGSTRRNGSTSQ